MIHKATISGERAQTVGAGMNLEREHLHALAEEGFDLAAISDRDRLTGLVRKQT